MIFRDERGQAVNEYLMIAGLMSAITIVVLGFTYGPGRGVLRAVANCVRTDDCAELEKRTTSILPGPRR